MTTRGGAYLKKPAQCNHSAPIAAPQQTCKQTTHPGHGNAKKKASPSDYKTLTLFVVPATGNEEQHEGNTPEAILRSRSIEDE